MVSSISVPMRSTLHLRRWPKPVGAGCDWLSSPTMPPVHRRTWPSICPALGIAADADEVITSAQAAAHYLADRLDAGSNVLVVGTTGLIDALRERGLTPVHKADDSTVAVVQGYSPDLNWKQLAEGAVANRQGVLWVATNANPTVPSPRGPLPGNGSLVAALRHATGARPVVTGKPDPTMHRGRFQRSGARNPLVVGDRLDTDIEGANATGCPSLLVLTGVTGPSDLLGASPVHRPTLIGHDLRSLLHSHPAPSVDGGASTCGTWAVQASEGGELLLSSRTGGGERLGPRRRAGRAARVVRRSVVQARCAHRDRHPDRHQMGGAQADDAGSDTAREPDSGQAAAPRIRADGDEAATVLAEAGPRRLASTALRRRAREDLRRLRAAGPDPACSRRS